MASKYSGVITALVALRRNNGIPIRTKQRASHIIVGFAMAGI